MATSATKITVPAGTDLFDPQGDMVDLAESAGPGLIIPVANTTERNALPGLISWTPSAALPLRVWRANASPSSQLEYTTYGTTWRAVVAAPPYVVANRTTDLGVATAPSGDGTVVTWNILESDRISYSGGTFTVSDAGVYHLAVVLDWEGATGGDRLCRVRKNGSGFSFAGNTNPSTTSPTQSSVAIDLEMSSGDTLAVWARQSSGATLQVRDDYTRFSLRRVR